MNGGLIRWVVVLGVAALATGAAAAAPHWLRGLEAFRVQRVEVTGTRDLSPDEVLRASGITSEATVFDDPEPWRERLLRLPQVADVRIERKVPARLIIRITEAEPVALAAVPALEPVDARGVLLPMPATGAVPDVPVVPTVASTANHRIRNVHVLRVLGALDAIRRHEPGLAAAISEATPAPDQAVRLRLRSAAGVELWIPANPSVSALERLEQTLEHLAARGELTRARRVDARFADQVVVTFNPQRGRE
ncbi:MAG: FtsQ-type POTRA domain-containing protein [Gemmatimonadetes bacterium]|nr:FtsQ-type POTRA domain-containing protein [Gemmatimonadota bacterium]